MDRLLGPEDRSPVHQFHGGIGLVPSPHGPGKMVLFYTRRNDPKVSPGRARGKSPLAAGNSVQRARRLLSRLRRLKPHVKPQREAPTA
jgi:hypothetical protein